MTLDQLRIFAEVARHQHITKAAKAMHMTQSAVSAAVIALEERHGVALFDRIGRSIVLNQTGSIFLKHALQVLAEAKKQGLADINWDVIPFDWANDGNTAATRYMLMTQIKPNSVVLFHDSVVRLIPDRVEA